MQHSFGSAEQYENKSGETSARLGLAENILPPDTVVIPWDEEDWSWLLIYRELSLQSPHLYRQIYKNYLNYYRARSI